MSGAQVEDPTGAIADGLYQLLEPVVLECDERVASVRQSQDILAGQIDELSEKLNAVQRASDLPALTPYVNKLQKSRQRLNNVNGRLSAIQQRIDKMYAMYAPELPRAQPEPPAPVGEEVSGGGGDGEGEGESEGVSDNNNNDDDDNAVDEASAEPAA